MKGILSKTNRGWVVKILVKENNDSRVRVIDQYPVSPEDLKTIKQYGDYSVDWDGKEVEYEIIDEFTHPQYYESVGWGDGVKYAKLK